MYACLHLRAILRPCLIGHFWLCSLDFKTAFVAEEVIRMKSTAIAFASLIYFFNSGSGTIVQFQNTKYGTCLATYQLYADTYGAIHVPCKKTDRFLFAVNNNFAPNKNSHIQNLGLKKCLYFAYTGYADLQFHECNYHDVKHEWHISEGPANSSNLFIKIEGKRETSEVCATAGGNPRKSSEYVNMFTCKFHPEQLWKIVKIRD